MRYSASAAYAIQAMVRLTVMTGGQGRILMKELCDGTRLPRPFVAKIFQSLVRRGLLTSAKGRGGGFALARPADRISLHEIITAVDGTADLPECASGLAGCHNRVRCDVHKEWAAIREEVRDFLQSTTLAAEAAARSHACRGKSCRKACRSHARSRKLHRARNGLQVTR